MRKDNSWSNEVETMTALDSIIAWAESDLPDWQSDAVRRLLVKDALSNDDRQDILSMLKARHELLSSEAVPPIPHPLLKGMVSGAPKLKAEIVLMAVKGLHSVNRIPDGSTLPFGHQGLTAIYGENGSGKSGYARVLKRACRARDTQERILSNVYNTATTVPAKAIFKLSINAGPAQEIEWEDGKLSDEILTNITVFDSKCARVIIDERNEASYLPYGTIVFEKLVNLLNWLKHEIETEKPKPEPLSFTELSPETKPGIFLASINYRTTKKEVEDAFTWSEDDDDKLIKLSRQLADLEANDPIKLAARTRSFKDRVIKLMTYVDQRTAALSDDQLNKFKEKRDNFYEADKALVLALQTTLNDEPLSGAGENAWQILYNAARDYSTKDAYPDTEFPVVSDEGRCVFCMQSLSQDAKLRLLRFKTFMEQTIKQKHEMAKNALDSTIESIKALNDKAAADQHTNTIDEVKQRDEATFFILKTYLGVIDNRLQYFDCLNTGNKEIEIPALTNNPITALARIIDALENEAIEFENAADPIERDKIKIEKAELLARKCFTNNLAKILAYLVDLQTVRKCDLALSSTDTAAITRKGKNIVSETLTPQLRGAIQTELILLGADHLPLNLKTSGNLGETLHQFELKGAKPDRKVNLTDILSEGEQRVVALAGFLAEVGLGENSCPIVLDDPVCSLDHRYRTRIAARLVSESQKRQVILFTHDIAFLLDLQEKAGELDGIYFTAQTILKQNEASGIPNEGLPWHAMPVKDRMEHLREKLNIIKAFYDTDQMKYDKEASFLYAMMRETWEAAIEEVVFNKTIVRHGSEVQTLRLKNVGVTTDQYKAIDINMSKCSTWMAGHDKSKKLDVHRPIPNEILADIDTINTFVKDCRKAGEILNKERNVALQPDIAPLG